MENERIKAITSESEKFTNLVNEAKLGNKDSMEEILLLFKDEIEYLSKFIMLPQEETYQALQTELIDIIVDKL